MVQFILNLILRLTLSTLGITTKLKVWKEHTWQALLSKVETVSVSSKALIINSAKTNLMAQVNEKKLFQVYFYREILKVSSDLSFLFVGFNAKFINSFYL